MGAGTFPAFGPAGFDPVYNPASAAPPISARALKYDPSIRQFVLLDERGNAIDVDPVDQIVAIRLTTFVGQSGSQPTLGTRLLQITASTAPDRIPQAARSEVARVLSDLVASGDVRLVSVNTFNGENGRYIFTVSYANLRTAPDRSPVATNLEVAA